jgi:hypothetical protein
MAVCYTDPMPSVNLSPETYEKLVQLAKRRGMSPDEVAEVAVVRDFRETPMSAEEWLAEWDRATAEIRGSIPAHVAPEELQADLDRALEEARAKRRARGN